MNRRRSPPAPPARPVDQSWDARATALRREGPANMAMLAAIVSVLAALLAWVAVLVPAPGSVRGSPVFWLLALPVMAWTGPLLSFREWAVRPVPLILAGAPLAALGAMEAARIQQASDILSDDRLDTLTAMLVILGVSLLSALVGLVALRRSSLPGGTRPATFAVPGSMPPGLYKLSNDALWSLRVGSLALSGAMINGVFCAIVTLLDTATGDLGPIWPVVVPALPIIAAVVLTIRGIRGLVRRRDGAGTTLRRSWQIGAGAAALDLLLVWAWPTEPTLKLAFSAFMVPMALAAAWGAHARSAPCAMPTTRRGPDPRSARMQRAKGKRRHRDPPPPPMPFWKRMGAAALFLGLGGVMAALGISGLAGWIGALVAGAASMTTDSFILGLPLLGLAMVALGPEFVAPRALALWSDERKAWLGKAVLGTMLVGLVLVFTGQIIINIVMAVGGYRACHVGGRGRYLDVTWAREAVACPPVAPGP